MPTVWNHLSTCAFRSLSNGGCISNFADRKRAFMEEFFKIESFILPTNEGKALYNCGQGRTGSPFTAQAKILGGGRGR